MRKFWTVLGFAIACLVAAVAWELVFYEVARDDDGSKFQRRLQQEEEKVDLLLEGVTPRNVNFTFPWNHKGTVLVVYDDGELAYWSNERVGARGLYHRLKSGGCFQKINNVYYDIRSRRDGDREYFALIMVREDYPSTNKYIRNHFNPVLEVDVDNVEKLTVRGKDERVGNLIRNRDGEPLFRLENTLSRVDYQPNNLILVLYLAFFFLLLYAYGIRLERCGTCAGQLWHAAGFFLLLVAVRLVMNAYHLPGTLYHLSVFRTMLDVPFYAISVGDLFVSMFIGINYLFFTLGELRIDDVAPRLVRFRYLFLVALTVLVFFYANLLHLSVSSLIENTTVSLNIARLVDVDLVSLCLFVILIVMGVGLVVLLHYSVSYLKLLFSFRRMMIGVTLVSLLCVWLAHVLRLPMPPLESLFVLGFYYLFVLNGYKVKEDARKSVYVLAFVIMSVYVVFLAKSQESYRESAVRARYASELIRERDIVLERRLVEVQDAVLNWDRVDSLTARGEWEAACGELRERMTALVGTRFTCEVECDRLEPSGASRGEREDSPSALLEACGRRVPGTDFYHIERFDGKVTYVGRFPFPAPGGEAVYYVGLENSRGYNEEGYYRLLAQVLNEPMSYPYSYGKYIGGTLVASQGDFNYYKSLTRFRNYNHVQMLDREGYSHMIVPVGDDGTCVISLNNDVFHQYYLNIFYALFVCLLLASYGMFFRWGPRDNLSQKRKSLQVRVRNHIIYLIVGLALVMTVLSIVINVSRFEQRHRAQMIELSRYVVSELEEVETADASVNPQITQLLSNIYDIARVDVNVYNRQGRLVATSNTSIFENGYDGFLLNPVAFQHIVREGNQNLIQAEKIGELYYRAVYMPLELTNGGRFVLNIPYFAQSNELNMDIFLIFVVSVNIAVVVIVLAFLIASFVANRITKPLQMMNDRLRHMKLGEGNEKIDYDSSDEVGELIKVYNEMVDKLADNTKRLARSEREGAWMGMARQIAHEIKNPLTPMKLNLQFLQRVMDNDNPEELRRRVANVSALLIEQIDYMTSIASAFSDFSKLQVMNRELFNLSELVDSCARLFSENVDLIQSDVVPGVFVYGDKEQMNRVIVNLLKNAEQSIPDGREGRILVRLYTEEGNAVLSVKDNGEGIPEDIREHVMEPNFTTKSGGTGLGLAMSHKIVENMGGTLTFISKVGVGTIFYVTLKYRELD